MKKLWFLGLAFSLILGDPPSSFPQDDSGEVVLDEIVITATKGETPLKQVGSSITVITGEELEREQIRDMTEVLRRVPGLSISQAGGRGGFTSLFARGGESDYVLVLVDGVQINDTGGRVDFSELSTENIERIEILRGPQSALYGTEAVTAVVQVFTRKGSGPKRVRVSSAFGRSYEEHKGIYENRIGLSGEGYSFSFERIDDGGILPFNDRFYRNTYSGRFDLLKPETFSGELTFRVEDSLTEFASEGAGVRLQPPDPNQYSKEDRVTIGTRVEQVILPFWSHQIRLGYTDKEANSIDPPDPGRTCSGFECDGIITTTFQPQERRFSGEYLWNLDYQPTEKIGTLTTLGFEYKFEDLIQSLVSDFGFGPTIETIDHSRTNRAFYFQEQLSIGERLFLSGGVRVEDSSLFGRDANPRAAAAYLIKPIGLKVRGSIGTGIKAPTFGEQFGSSFAVGNPNLDPEQSRSWDAGLDQSLGEWGSLGVTYFANRFRDLVAFVGDPDPLDPDFLNIQKARSRGVEISGEIFPVSGFYLGGTLNYLSTSVTDDGGVPALVFSKGERLLRRPVLSGTWNAGYQAGGVSLGLDGRYVGERDDMDFENFLRVKNPGYSVWNTRISYEIDEWPGNIDRLKLFGRIANLFNKQYEDVYGSPSPRRSYVAGLEFSF